LKVQKKGDRAERETEKAEIDKGSVSNRWEKR